MGENIIDDIKKYDNEIICNGDGNIISKELSREYFELDSDYNNDEEIIKDVIKYDSITDTLLPKDTFTSKCNVYGESDNVIFLNDIYLVVDNINILKCINDIKLYANGIFLDCINSKYLELYLDTLTNVVDDVYYIKIPFTSFGYDYPLLIYYAYDICVSYNYLNLSEKPSDGTILAKIKFNITKHYDKFGNAYYLHKIFTHDPVLDIMNMYGRIIDCYYYENYEITDNKIYFSASYTHMKYILLFTDNYDECIDKIVITVENFDNNINELGTYSGDYLSNDVYEQFEMKKFNDKTVYLVPLNYARHVGLNIILNNTTSKSINVIIVQENIMFINDGMYALRYMC